MLSFGEYYIEREVENMVFKKRTIVEEYYYDSEEEKNIHSRTMKDLGYEDSMQVNENVGSIYNPEYRLCGRYYKYEYE